MKLKEKSNNKLHPNLLPKEKKETGKKSLKQENLKILCKQN